MASDNECMAAFPRSQVCNDRTFARLLGWASYIAALPLPPAGVAPPKAEVQQIVLAQKIPATAQMYTTQVSPYLLETPTIQQKVRIHLSQWNTDADEVTLSSDIDSAMATVMPKFADAVVSDQEVANWCDKNGYPRPPGLVNVAPPPIPNPA
jgi:hypothetical protein